MTNSPKSETDAEPEVLSGSQEEQQPESSSNSEDTEKVSTEAPIKTEHAPLPSNVPVQKSGNGLSIMALLLSLLAVGGSAYTWYENNLIRAQQETDLAVDVTEIGGQVTRLGDAISRLQRQQSAVVTQAQLTTRILEANSAFDLQLRDVKQAQETLGSALQKVNNELQSSGVNSYVVDEVSQLLKLANNNVLFSNNAEAAINALELADIQLKEMADPRFALVRRKINEEMELLRNVQPVDIESLNARLQGLAQRIPALKLENERPSTEIVAPESAESSSVEERTLRDDLKKMWYDFISLAEIQRVDQPPKPLLTPEQRYFLNQNIQLQLTKAELGVLQQRPVVFQQALTATLDWLNGYFDVNDENVKQTIDQVTQLQSEPISVELPLISGSYEALQSIKGGQ